MSFVNHTNQKLYVTSGENILLLDMESGNDQKITLPELKISENKEIKSTVTSESRNITSLEFSKCSEYIVVATENKWVVIYNKKFEIVRSFAINRIASKVYCTPKNDILVADKSGDVYLYEQNSDKGILLLGHRSVILDLILSNCGKYIITCDRDEKIRVSCFPNCYNIVSYCLGHSEFVTRIKLCTDTILVSSSGDGTIRFWNFIKGEELNVIDTNEYIEDPNLLKKFASRFEKTEISALPIADMDIYHNHEHYLAVSICGCDLIQLYKVNLCNLSFTYLTKFIFDEPFRFCLSDNLYIFNSKVSAFSYLHENYSNLNLKILDMFSNKYKDVMKTFDNDFISLLYKRKFDNVQEYMERKRQRIEIK